MARAKLRKKMTTNKWILDFNAIRRENEEEGPDPLWDICMSLGAPGPAGMDADITLTISNDDLPEFIERLKLDVLQMQTNYEEENKEDDDDAREAS
jgi:hypothetical protein